MSELDISFIYFNIKDLNDILPQWFSHVSTEVLDGTGVSVSQKEIDPHDSVLSDFEFHFFKIKARTFQSHQILDDWTEGGDDVEISQILQKRFRRKIFRGADVILIQEENYWTANMLLFQLEAQVLRQVSVVSIIVTEN